jgi:uncharacterized protein YigA (DUF484 family)
MTSPINGDTVAQYLRDNPSFFDVHAELLASVTVPHPHGGRAVSLVERQVDVLRDKHKVLEMRLADLIRIGRENDAIGERLQRWTRDLLRERDLRRLPAIVTDGLADGFSVPQVALRLWRLPEMYQSLACATEVPAAIHTRIDELRQPYCGLNAEVPEAAWLAAGGSQTRSLALLPMRVGAAPESFGLLVLGSPDPARFQASMGTAYLERIAETASAALSRLLA